MATNVLDLKPKPRRAGLTAKGHVYASLHRKELRAASPTDIYGPPIDSSDEASIAEVKGSIEATSETDGRKKLLRTKKKATLDTGSPKREGTLEHDAEPYGNTADIVPTVWTSQEQPRSHNRSQGSKKRKSILVEEENDMMGTFATSQTKRLKAAYGSSQSRLPNIHTEKQTERKKSNNKKNGSRCMNVEKNGFKKPDPDALIASVNKYKGPSGGTSWHQSLDGTSASKSQDGSQQFSSSTEQTTQDSGKIGFRKPPKVAPTITATKAKNVPKFRDVHSAGQEGKSRRSTRSLASGSTGKPVLQEALSSATNRLGLPELQFKRVGAPPVDSVMPSATLDAETLDKLHGSAIFDENDPYASNDGLAKRPSSCPWCKEVVDKSFLEEVSTVGERLSLRRQAEICKSHKRRTAHAEWFKKGYPSIDWSSFSSRIGQHLTEIDTILQRKRASFYRNAFEDSTKKGNDRNLKHNLMTGGSIDDMCTGYYGTRGARIMMETIMSRFASKIRRLSASDKLISSGGITGFVQAVLVPEMAVLLIQDDMDIKDQEDARTVLRDSVDVGRILNDEEDEIIQDSDPNKENLQG